VNFAEQPPSKQWATLKYRGQKFAEVWFKPEAEPFGLTFRIPQEIFQAPGMAKQLTIENLLKAVAMAIVEVESWREGEVPHEGMNGSNPEFKNALAPPQQDLRYLEISVRLQRPSEAADSSPEERATSEGENSEAEDSPAMWQDLEARWKAILGLEALMDSVRISMESLFAEMDNSVRKTLSIEEKTYALRADVAQWERAKSRVQFALPKMKDFIHRSVWALGAPERKRLEELYKDHIQPQIVFPHMQETLKQLEELQKARQVLSAHGKTVYQESKAIAVDVQGALRMLQNNAAANAKNKKGGSGSKGKFFKDIRRWTGA
jgi:hypothetical protein